MAELPATLDVDVMAAALYSTPAAVRDACRRGDIPAVKHLGKWTIERGDFLRWYRGPARRLETSDTRADRLVRALGGDGDDESL